MAPDKKGLACVRLISHLRYTEWSKQLSGYFLSYLLLFQGGLVLYMEAFAVANNLNTIQLKQLAAQVQST